MANNSSINIGGGGFFGMLTIVFVVLKLTGTINWSWFWVLSPLIAGIALSFLIIALVLVVMCFFKRGY